MSTDEGAAAVAKAPPPATEKDWGSVCDWARVGDRFAPCLLELRRRVEALEAAGGVAGNPGHASVAPAGVSAEELADSLPANAWAGPEGYSRQAFARHLLDHPRIGPLLRGEGAPAPKRVVLPEDPPFRRMPYVEGPWSADDLARAVRAAAHVGHVFRLTSIICDAITDSDGNRQPINPITLAQRILNDPRSQWAPAQEVEHD